jgi:HTH-type transcriptional regulator/antitoxin HigA
MLAWVRRAEALTAEQRLPTFERSRLLEALPHLLELTASQSAVSRVPDVLATAGIHFVVVPHLQKTYIDGAALETGDRPIVAVSLRYDRIDSFWFTLMHELAHLALGHEGSYVDNLDDPARSKNEKQADRAAGDWLIEPRAYEAFVRSAPRPFSLSSIEAFARNQSRHPGLVVGRLQHDGLAEWTHFRKTLVKVSPALRGWIDVPASPSLAS